jgi:hypothetical protein
MIILIVLAKIAGTIGLMYGMSGGSFFGGMGENMFAGFVFYSLLSYYVFALRELRLVPSMRDGFVGFVMGLAIVLIMPFLPFFVIGWGLEQLLPESVASNVMDVLLVLTMLAFVARDVSKVLALFRKEEPIET